jgi:hypothetical protein
VDGIPETYFSAAPLDSATIVPNGELLICTATSAATGS